ncbi:hypothetical protein Y88_1071 [Novosphingobium nitrogenifigens DSM 19370]|uniref:Uncharacterized protein n=1 Tax=Novosphingobium nitrogenifigens DSM 19370 TaxID=983920 RepID=F1Z8L6_9SPHN|nr:FMN-binding negative transcriptional regulator [Novosphingobium nitrogenifigens]EGD59009.1 hypothetical protein Y88_1071 [Novosphingobium nitrogenifigens DSM 19370]
MYVPQAFRQTDPPVLFSTIRDRPLGLLITHGESGIEANHIPFLLIEDGNGGGVIAGLSEHDFSCPMAKTVRVAKQD